MKAEELVKTEKTIEEIYDQIKNQNENGYFKIFIPHFQRLSDKTRLKLSDNGFKVYRGQWFTREPEGYIIEWE